jgi:glycine/D-amino acid oxidase-like deaminating enzyme
MRVVVVGAGVFGTWSAHHLLDAGAEVTLVDAYGPGNSRSSSGDETRIVRCGYGGDRIYSEMARASLHQWRAFDARVGGNALWHPCGVLWLAAGHDSYTAATHRVLQDDGHVYEVLERRSLHDRYPEIDPTGLEVALLEPDCGVVLARRAVRLLAADLERRGARIVRALVQEETGTGPGTHNRIALADGSHISADRFVFACGAWLPRLFDPLLGGRIRATRQVVVYFGTAAGDRRFESPRWPAWIDFPAGIYGTPDIDGRGVKVGIDEHGPPIDPDTTDRVADAASIEKARDWLARRVPALALAPVIESRVCQYENTSSGDFLIDRHPEHAHVWMVGGGSGHGFKHGPAVGELVARMVMRDEPAEPRFALSTKGTDARRAIY